MPLCTLNATKALSPQSFGQALKDSLRITRNALEGNSPRGYTQCYKGVSLPHVVQAASHKGLGTREGENHVADKMKTTVFYVDEV